MDFHAFASFLANQVCSENEEYIVDKLFHANPSILRPIQRYQIGEWYTPVAEFTDEELQRVYFWHEHLLSDPAYDKIRQKVEYFNRMRKKRDQQKHKFW